MDWDKTMRGYQEVVGTEGVWKAYGMKDAEPLRSFCACVEVDGFGSGWAWWDLR